VHAGSRFAWDPFCVYAAVECSSTPTPILAPSSLGKSLAAWHKGPPIKEQADHRLQVQEETSMSIRAIPLLVFAFILYNLIALAFGGTDPGEALSRPIFSITLLSKGVWTFTWGDLIILTTLVLLFCEIVKSTFTSTSTLIDHALSMIVFVACLVEFLMIPQAATSVFFTILVATLIDVIAGYTIGIRVAKRDIGFGSDQ
jgi:hypothetical protein